MDASCRAAETDLYSDAGLPDASALELKKAVSEESFCEVSVLNSFRLRLPKMRDVLGYI